MGGRRILVLEDEPTAMELLVAALRDEGYVAEGALSGETAIGSLSTFRPELALVDVDLDDGPDGITTARALRHAFPDLPLVFLTAANDQEHRLRAFATGADDYIAKPFSFLELVARVEAVLRRAGSPPRRTLEVGDLTLDLDAYSLVRGDTPIALTTLEFGLMEALMRSAGTPLAKRQLLVEVWGYDDEDVNVVEVTVSALRKKLEAAGDRIIITVRGVGYLLRLDGPLDGIRQPLQAR